MRDVRVRATGVLAVLVLAAGYGGCGGDDDTAKELDRQEQRRQGREEGRREERIRELERKLGERKKKAAPNGQGGSGGSSSGGLTSCGGGVSAGPSTSCAFAQEVKASYDRAGGGNTTVYVHSPTTGQNYYMTCGQSAGEHVCTGGNGASVHFP
jgi:hypothetical protein